MKRVWPAWLLLFLGAFFLVTAGVAKFWATDAIERIPLNSYQRTYLTGPADLLDPTTGKTNHVKVKITNITQVDHARSDNDVVVFVTSTCVNQDVDNPADCLPVPPAKTDPRVISNTKLNFAADRHTAEAVDDPSVPNTPPVRGLVNKWPFYPKEQAYDVWDDVSKQATSATFVGTTTVQGLKCNLYHQVITDQPIDLGNDIGAIYSLDETYTIDAVTGKIINQQIHDVRTLADGGDTALDLRAVYTPATIKANVDDAKTGGRQVTVVSKVLPVVGLVVGLICVVAGVLLLLRRRRHPAPPEPAAAEPAPAAS
jgi:hypothetical protein